MREPDEPEDSLLAFPPENAVPGRRHDRKDPVPPENTAVPGRRDDPDDPQMEFLPEDAAVPGRREIRSVAARLAYQYHLSLSRIRFTVRRDVLRAQLLRTALAVTRWTRAALPSGVARATRLLVVQPHVPVLIRLPFPAAVIAAGALLFLCGVGVGAVSMWLATTSLAPAPPRDDIPPASSAAAPPTPPPVSQDTTLLAPVPATASLPVARPQSAAAAARGSTSAQTASPAVSFRGSLAVRSRPEGAQVFINGSLAGATPLTLRNQPVGSRAVRLSLEGYEIWTASVRVVADQQTEVTVTLQRGPE